MYVELTNNENRYESVPILDNEIIRTKKIDNNYRMWPITTSISSYVTNYLSNS